MHPFIFLAVRGTHIRLVLMADMRSLDENPLSSGSQTASCGVGLNDILGEVELDQFLSFDLSSMKYTRED
jgi:hypothetical protein